MLYHIWLANALGAGNAKGKKILEIYHSPKELWELGADEIRSVPFLSEAERDLLTQTSPEDFEWVLRKSEGLGINVVCYSDEHFPKKLKNIAAPPLVLYYAGQLDGIDDDLQISVVGTRKASDISLRTTGNLCYELSKRGIVVVSGGAVGIDHMAHAGALQANARTIMFIGTGHDRNYPAGSMGFKRDVVKHGGCIISEFMPTSEVSGRNFPIRNRLLAAVANGVVVAEAPEKSGALITASLGVELGRDIFCIPPPDIYDKRYDGVKPLLRAGAICLLSCDDVFMMYENDFELAPRVDSGLLNRNTSERLSSLTTEQVKLFMALKNTPMQAYELEKICELSFSECTLGLAMLEISGLAIRTDTGGFVRR